MTGGSDVILRSIEDSLYTEVASEKKGKRDSEGKSGSRRVHESTKEWA